MRYVFHHYLQRKAKAVVLFVLVRSQMMFTHQQNYPCSQLEITTYYDIVTYSKKYIYLVFVPISGTEL